MPIQDRDELLDEAITQITETARGHLANKKGHMTWAEANNVLRRMKTQTTKESPTNVTTEVPATPPVAAESYQETA